MNFDLMDNNKVKIVGLVISNPTYSHEMFGESFYEFKMEVPRLSDCSDIIPITISERLMENSTVKIGEKLAINGQFRSYNKMIDNKSKLMLTIFVREILKNETEFSNCIDLTGYVCKDPIYRVTPFKREITDILIAVNRSYNKSDYLPCIAWGRNAKYIKDLKVGEKISVIGRIQSREYVKKTDDDSKSMVAYEVSLSKIIKIMNDEYKEKPIFCQEKLSKII